MSIHMIRGYVAPPSGSGAMYSGFKTLSEYGYMYITQEGEASSEPNAAAFAPTEHWDEYGNHPTVNYQRPPGLDVPGPLGRLMSKNCGCQSCDCEPGGPPTYGRYGEMSSGAKTLIGAAVLFGIGSMLFKKSRRSRRR